MNGRWLGVLLVLWGVSSASAQDMRAQARQHFQEGVRRYDTRDYEGALSEFNEAYRLKPHPSVRVNIANCYERLGKPVEAVKHFEAYLSEAGTSIPSAERRQIQRTVARLQRAIGTLTLQLSPPGATVRIDGQPVDQVSSGPISLAEGAHVLEVEAPGYAPERRQIAVRGQDRTVETIALASTSPQRSTSAVAQTDDTETWSKLHFKLTTPVLVAGGITAAILVSAIVTGVLALSADSDFEDALARSRDPSLNPAQRDEVVRDGQDSADTANTLATVTDVLLIGTVIGAGVTTFLLFTEADKERINTQASRPRLMASPYVDRNQAGFTLKGRF